MANELFNTVVSELEIYVGDILARGITKMGVTKAGSNVEYVGVDEMEKALDTHIIIALQDFMTPEKARNCVRTIKKKVDNHGKAI